MTIELTPERVKQLVHEVVAERGEGFCYSPPDGASECKYINTDRTYSCLVGGVLVKAGVPARVIENFEGIDASDLIGELTARDILDPVPAGVVTALSVAQEKQDVGTPYGEVLTWFDAHIARA